MLNDREENGIILSDKPNPHILILGGSGQGKTYYCCRKMEEGFERGRRIIIFDYSGSYREKELEKMGFRYAKNTRILNPYMTPYYVLLNTEDSKKYQKIIADALVNVLGIQGYVQKTVLSQAIKIHVGKMHMKKKHPEDHVNLNFKDLFETLKEIYAKEQDEDNLGTEKDGLLKILTRIEPYADIEHIKIMHANYTTPKSKITIVQLSDFSECQRHFLAEFLINLLWADVKINAHTVYGTIFLDEFQHLSMSGNGALSQMLREGRKFNMSLILSSQFIGNYNLAEKEALLQAGNILLFKPTVQDKRAFVDIVGGDKAKIWSSIFDNLKIGEAVLVGNYSLGNRSSCWTKPIVCRIK